MNSKYQEALDYLFSQLPMFSRTGGPAYKPGLDTSLDLAKFFGNPHNHFKSIHIGGTNGKGSTSHMIASVLQSQGYKTGLYTSPHLVDFRERIRINGKMIPEDKVVEFVDDWKNLKYEGKPSFFELTMIMGFKWFAEEKVDYAVIEVGMGGRLDSTNILTPLISVITNVSFDHTQFLGTTLHEIAGEKAGIIKKSVPVVIGEGNDETSSVFLNKAIKENAPLIFANHETPLTIRPNPEGNGWQIKYGGEIITSPLGGDYQKSNITTVISTIEQLKRLNIKITDASIKEGIEKVEDITGLSGRWTIISSDPLTIADTGHNLAGLSYNSNQLQNLIKERKDGKLRIILGFVADKAIDKIMNVLPVNAIYYITNAMIPRALPADQLYEKFIAAGLRGDKFPNVKEAYIQAKKEASKEDIIFIGGSTFIVADLFSD